MHTIAKTALKTITVEQREKQLEIRLLSIVRRRRQEQKVSSQSRHQLTEPVTLRVFDLTAEECR